MNENMIDEFFNSYAGLVNNSMTKNVLINNLILFFKKEWNNEQFQNDLIEYFINNLKLF